MRRVLCTLLLVLSCGAAHAQAWPSRPIQWIIPFVPGGGLDLLTRGYAPELSRALGQPIVPENRPANNGVVAQEFVAKAPGDGHILFTSGSGALTYNRLIYPGIQYDWERDFAPVTNLSKAPMALYVHASVPAGNLKDFIAYVKAQGSKLNYGAAGHGHPFHLAMELFKVRTGTEMLFVPYKGMAPVVQDTVAGRLHALFYPPMESIVSQIKAGKLRAIAVASDQRLDIMPDVPTFEDAGLPAFDPTSAIALYMPGTTPRDIVGRVNAEVLRISRTPELARVYQAAALHVRTTTPEGLSEQMRREYNTWAPLIKKLNIRAQ
jgi:tripartite-type tricarboxylate transporter receptor subunit TctC